MKYLIRMMVVLLAHDELTVTNLAMLSRMNYERCRNLLTWLLDSGYARTRLSKKRRFVALTQTGIEYAKRILELGNVRNSRLNPGTESTYKM
jgi:predicted transcriptional regulator